jgi:hypothetical protein
MVRMVAGSIPAGGSTKPMTSANAGQFASGRDLCWMESTSLVGMRSDRQSPSVLVDSSDQRRCRSALVLHLDHSRAQLLKSA